MADGQLAFTSGPKIAHFDRIEWVTLDPFSAQAALSRGEIDWWESRGRDLFPLVARDPLTRARVLQKQRAGVPDYCGLAIEYRTVRAMV